VKYKLQKRKGLGTVVGAVFMIIIIAGALNVIIWSLQQQNSVVQTLIQKESTKINNLNEKIDLSDIRVNSNKFNITISNTGGSVAHLKSIYIVNRTASPNQEYRYDIDNYVSGKNYTRNIGQSLPLIVRNDTAYYVKIVTQAGSSVSTNVSPLSSVPLVLSLYAIPPTVTPGSNVTLLMSVTNNNTSSVIAQRVSAVLTASCSPSCTLVKQSSAGNNTLLTKGSTILFKWIYNISGPDNTLVTFTAKIVNGMAGNVAIENVKIKLLAASQTNFANSANVISDKFVQRPNIYMIIPGPFGIPTNSGDKALWGTMVVNPTDRIMNVSRVVMTFIQPATTGNQQIVSSSCSLTAIAPVNGTWSCPVSNLLQWNKNINPSNPMRINPRSSYSFLVLVQPGSLSAGTTQFPSFLVDVTVFTSSGQFSKTGYASNIASNSAMPNVYVSNVANSTSPSNIMGHLNSVSAGAAVTLNVVLADLDTGTANKIYNGTRININIPPDWTNISIGPSGGFSNPQIVTFSDGSNQVTATLTAPNLDGQNSPPMHLAAVTIPITMTAPSSLTAKQIYIIYITTDGAVNTPNNFSVGALAEYPIQVNAP
jgi:hypothetical protein